jgi:hypothetical protein
MVGMRVTGIAGAVSAFKELENMTSASTYVVGVGAEYGAYVEFGTSTMRAQPYLFPAAREVLRTDFETLEQQATSLDDLVRLVALEIEAKATKKAPVDTGKLQNSIEAVPLEGGV